VRVTKKPVEGEEAYRLFVDELPESPQGRRTVNLMVRHSIPLFSMRRAVPRLKPHGA